MMKTIGDAICELREQAKVKQKELAKDISKKYGSPFSPTFIAKVELDDLDPDIERFFERLVMIANVLNAQFIIGPYGYGGNLIGRYNDSDRSLKQKVKE